MTFTSFDFLLFFPVVVILYNLVPKNFRAPFLLLASYVFYTFMQPAYLVLLVAVTLVTYGITRWMNVTTEEEKKRRIEVAGIIMVLLPLFFFKYFNFLNESVNSLFKAAGFSLAVPAITWVLPVGISFYTFMAIGYIVDVYNEEVDVEKKLCNVGLFLSFFPIVLSGPIERSGSMFPQLNNLQRSTATDVTSGLRMMLWGYFMKLCIADRLGLYINGVFNNVDYHNGTTLLIAALLYPFQIYADLGGYSLIAIGVARCLGIKIRPNFNRPFFATSMSELWRRWHMSLITWLTDYIYTPLSFNVRGWKKWGIVAALMLTFLISGLWHGAAMTFIVWGLIQGVYLSIEALMQKRRSQVETKYNLTKKWWYIMICSCFVFVLFAISQIFGRCSDLNEACVVIEKIVQERFQVPFLEKHNLLYAFIFMLLLFAKDFCDEYLPAIKVLNSDKKWLRYISYYSLVLIILEYMANSQSFIYFQF